MQLSRMYQLGVYILIKDNLTTYWHDTNVLLYGTVTNATFIKLAFEPKFSMVVK